MIILFPCIAGTLQGYFRGARFSSLGMKVTTEDTEKTKIQQAVRGRYLNLVKVLEAILTSRQPCEKLQCLYENLMSNNFRKTAVLKNI